MKKLALIIACAFIVISANAQLVQVSSLMVTEQAPAKAPYFGTAEFAMTLCGNAQYFGAQTVHGIKIGKGLYAGVGIGLGYYKYSIPNSDTGGNSNGAEVGGESPAPDFGPVESPYAALSRTYASAKNSGTDENTSNPGAYKGLSIPLFAHISYEFMEKKFSPYIAGNFGYDLLGNNIILNPSVGIRVNLPKGSLRAGVGCEPLFMKAYTAATINISYMFF